MKGVVAAGDPRSAAAGAAMFEMGGNAVDAAVAAAFASFVAETFVVNICGGGYGLVVEAGCGDSGKATAYDFFSSVPSVDTRRLSDFREISVDFVDEKQSFWIGRGSSAIPGAVAGLCRMARAKGTLSLANLLEPAIALARDGFHVTEGMARVLVLLAPIYTDTPDIARLFAPDGRLIKAGDFLAFPKLAVTLSQLADEGPALFYRGSIAEQIVEDHRLHGGFVTAPDLAAYEVFESRPVSVDYRGYQVLLPMLSSVGGVLIGFALKLLARVPLSGLEANGFRHLFTLANVMRLTTRARTIWERAWSAGKADIEVFLSDKHIDPFADELEKILRGDVIPKTAPLPEGPGNTSHISAMDKDGNAVSITTSAGEGAGYLVGETGLCLNNMLGEHDLNPDGFHRDPPGIRLRSMMSPCVILKDGKPVMAVGSAGSNRLRSAILQTISNRIDFGQNLDSSVNNSRVHFEGDLLQIEAGIPGEIGDALERSGFKVKKWRGKSIFFGGAQATSLFDGRLEGAADERRGGGVAFHK